MSEVLPPLYSPKDTEFNFWTIRPLKLKELKNWKERQKLFSFVIKICEIGCKNLTSLTLIDKKDGRILFCKRGLDPDLEHM